MTYYASQLKQAPDDMWRVLSFTNYFGIKKSPNPTVVKSPNNLVIETETVIGKLVYLKGADGAFTPYIKTKKSSPYPYIPIKSGNKLIVEPYYVWVVKNKRLFESEKPELISKAKSKLGTETLAAINSGEYTYAFDSATSGQVDLDLANYELLDEVRYSANSQDSRNLFKIKRDNTVLYIHNKEFDVLIPSDRRLNRGETIPAKGIVNKVFNYKLPEMVNIKENIFVPIVNLRKTDEGFVVDKNVNPIIIDNGKVKQSNKQIISGVGIQGSIVQPKVKKNFSFLIIDDTPEKTVFIKRRDANEIMSDFIGEIDLIDGKDRLLNAWDDAVNFEGGDIEDFYGGDVNFCCLDGTEIVYNFDTNNNVLGDFDNNVDIDLSFDNISNCTNVNNQLLNSYSNFLGKLFKKKDKKINEKQAKEIADKDKIEYTPEEVEVVYSKSGSRKPFGEWIRSNDAKQFLNTIQQLGHQFLMGKKNTEEVVVNNTPQGDDDTDDKILGMHPVTFGVVSIGTLVVLGLGVWLITRKK